MKDIEDRQEEVPTLEELSNYRGGKYLDMMEVWCTYFFPCVVGSYTFKKCAATIRLSHFLTTSDEAFAVLVLENFYERWKKEFELTLEGKKVAEGNKLPAAKWTEVNNSGGKGGWSNEGLLRFNTHMTNMNVLRETEFSVKLEEAYRTKVETEDVLKKFGGGKSLYKRESDEVVTFDDLSPVIRKKKQKDGKEQEGKNKRKDKDELCAALEKRYKKEDEEKEEDECSSEEEREEEEVDDDAEEKEGKASDDEENSSSDEED